MDAATELRRKVITISSDSSVTAAATKMRINKVACLVVTDENDKFTGIVTEQDLVWHAVSPLIDTEKTKVIEIMTPHVISCPPGTQVNKVREIMAANHIRHLPVVEDGDVVGMFSVRDVLEKQLVEDRAVAEQITTLSNCLKSMDLNEVANIITTEVPKLFQAQKCILCLYNNGIDQPRPAILSFNGCICSEEDLESLVDAEKLCDDCEFRHNSISCFCEKRGVESPHIVIPLNTSDSQQDSSSLGNPLSGYLCLCGLDYPTAANKDMISYKARLVRKIINTHLANATLYQHVRLTSLTDSLTAVGSRKLLEDKLEAEYARAQRYKHPFSVAIIDLDHFKTINDILGHAAGDNALRQIAKCMKDNQRATDVLTRYGGDEFVVLMPETRAKEALTLLERFRVRVQDIKIAENVPMTISCGVAEFLPEMTDSTSEVVRRADLALYEAKSSGRNCVKVWDKDVSKQLKGDELEEEEIKKLKRRIAGFSEQTEKIFMQSIWGLVQALEAKDPYAKSHSENVMHYSVNIAQTMKITPRKIKIIKRASMIHDIGKIGIPDAILTKPDKLTRREHKIIEEHPLIAVQILSKMEFLEVEMFIVRHHHEKWNGQGYPDGLSGTAIPLGARIMAVADTFDALTSSRSYHHSRSLVDAMKILVDSSGYEFDPKVVKSMINWIEKTAYMIGKNIDKLTLDDLLQSKNVDKHDSLTPVIDTPATCSVRT